MDLNKFLNENSDINLLKRFAFLGRRESFDGKLNYLVKISEEEDWYQKDHYTEETISIIFYYIVHTFDQLFKQGKIIISEDEDIALANTGLMTSQGDEIYFYFEKSSQYDPHSPTSNYWHLVRFIVENSREFQKLDIDKPELATYFDDYNELYFNPDLEIMVDFDHLFTDNYDRLPNTFKSMPIDTARVVFNGFLELTKKKIRRNNRIPVPQFYRDEIMFLIPVPLIGDEMIVIALEKIADTYRGNTTLTKVMAYNCARLLTKPESNWLLADK